jgi:hypothetical protein
MEQSPFNNGNKMVPAQDMHKPVHGKLLPLGPLRRPTLCERSGRSCAII